MKPTSPYPLYPKTGIHWSNYGEALALDSLIRYMEKVKNRKMVDFGWEEVEMSDDLRVPDKDIADGMNLLFNIGYYPMPYPKFHFNEDPTTYKPVVITVTDSYYWNLHGRGITQRIYSKDKFWYYFQTAHGPYPAGQQVNDLDILAEVESADFIVLMATDANLYKFDFGFAEKIFGLIQDQQKQAASKREARIKEVELVIRGNAEWMKAIREKAAKQGIPFDEMIRLDAIWMIENQKNGNKQ
jgi:predicted DNA binding CopG/RHH family protein